jgi:hypothetical protein
MLKLQKTRSEEHAHPHRGHAHDHSGHEHTHHHEDHGRDDD